MKKTSVFIPAILCSLLAVMMALPAAAETKENRQANPHQLRIGAGDEFILWGASAFQEPDFGDRPKPQIPANATEEEKDQLLKDFRYTRRGYYRVLPSFFVEYLYRFNNWFSWGGSLVFSPEVQPNNREYNGYDELQRRYTKSWVTMSIVPTARFTYYWADNVSLYSSIGVGPSIYMGPDIKFGHHFGAAYEICALGVEWGREHWFGSFELGMRNDMVSEHYASKLVSFGAGYRF